MVRGVFRARNGEHRRLSATGATEAEAHARLAAKADGVRPLAQRPAAIGAHSTILQLSEYWLAKRRLADDTAKEQTLQTYERWVRNDVGTAVGSLLVAEATTPVLEHALLEAAMQSRSRAKRARAMLHMIFDEAVRLGLTQVNPVAATSHFRPPAKEVVTLSIGDIRTIRLELARVIAIPTRYGPARTERLARLVEVLLGTGLRIGEVLALRACDITPVVHEILADGELHSVSGLDVFVGATMTQITGRGAVRQESPKHDRQRRRIFVSGAAAAALLSSIDQDAPETQTVFHARNGSPLSSANVRRDWRRFVTDSGLNAIIDVDARTITPHTFRRTVATMIWDSAKNPRLASELLGHADETTTRLHYVKHSGRVDPLSALLLQRLLQESGDEG